MTLKTKQKGWRTVRKGNDFFRQNGYIGANLEKTGRFIKEKDLFNLWDNLYIKGNLHIFVQYKTNMCLGVKKPRKWLTPFIDFAKEHGSIYVKYYVFNSIDYKGFQMFDCMTKKNEKKNKI